MIFKIEKLEDNVHIVRGYRKEDDIKFCFSCVLHKAKNEKQWHIHIAMSSEIIGGRSILEATKYLKNYPGGTYSYVSKADFERFYKRFCKKIKFDDYDF